MTGLLVSSARYGFRLRGLCSLRGRLGVFDKIRDVDAKHGSAPGRTPHLDTSPKRLHDEIVDDVQPKPSAAALARGGEERIEHAPDLIGGDAASIVGHFE